jgi:hypothetical protein
MNSSLDYDDDDCHSVQLEGSDMAPRAAKVSFICLFQNIYQLTLCYTDNPTTEIHHETI